MTFKELKKRINSSFNQQKQQTQSLDKLQNKPFWIWNIEEHKQEDVRTKGDGK
jgi:Mg2+ and Co2+ transporter CorA